MSYRHAGTITLANRKGVVVAKSKPNEYPSFPQATTREEFLKWRQDLIDYKPEKK